MSPSETAEKTIQKIVTGDVRSAARLIRDLDDRDPAAREILRKLFPYAGRAFVLGVTGSPGVGKSTLTNGLIRFLRDMGKTVGVLAVDPTSPFTGGAILGDRVRMQKHSTDEGVFIRSMATRGHFGGLTMSTRGAITVLDAMGKDVIIVETVGVGQDEVDIARTADTTVIVLAPGWGDDIQALKAGILEVGDIFVVNKADREGAEKTVQELRAMVEMGPDRDWRPPVLQAVAVRHKGIEELWAAVEEHRSYLAAGAGEHYRRLNRLKHKLEVIDLVKQGIVDRVLMTLEKSGELDRYVDRLTAGETDPYSVSDEILERILGGP
jgi:LAO/AO transport system kinase